MFCGGVFLFKNDSDDFFICSDGIEMNQQELLNIVRGVISYLHSSPLEAGNRRVVFIEAASTLIYNHKGFIFGVSTYHPLSIPLLSSTMDRTLNCVNAIFGQEITLSSYKERSTLFHALRQLLSSTPGAPVSSQLVRSFNNVNDMSLNHSVLYKMDPEASGELEVSGHPTPADLNTESAADSSTPNFTSGIESNFSSMGLPDTQTQVRAKVSSVVKFTVQNKLITESQSSTAIELAAQNDSGPLAFTIQTKGNVVKAAPKGNTREISNLSFTCDSVDTLKQEHKVLDLYTTHQGEEPPLMIFARTMGGGDEPASIDLVIDANAGDIEALMLAFSSCGLENAMVDKGELISAPNADPILVKIDSIRNDERHMVSVKGTSQAPLTSLSEVSFKCIIRNATLGQTTITTSGKYELVDCTYKTVVDLSTFYV